MMSEKTKIILGVLTIILFFSYVVVISKKKGSAYHKELLSLELNGVVNSVKYENKQNYVSCTDGSYVKFNIDWDFVEMDKYNGVDIGEVISKGDSVIKIKGESILQIKSTGKDKFFNINMR